MNAGLAKDKSKRDNSDVQSESSDGSSLHEDLHDFDTLEKSGRLEMHGWRHSRAKRERDDGEAQPESIMGEYAV